MDNPREPALIAPDHGRLARESVIFDLHNDAMTQIYEAGGNLDLFTGNRLECSLPRLKAGGVRAAFFAVWVPKNHGPRYEDTLIELFYQLLDRNQDQAAFAASCADLERNLAAGKLSAFLGIEGGKAIGDDLDQLDYFYARGVRYLTLTWNQSNLIADSSMDSNQPHHGLSAFGRQVIQRMNRLGMIVDLSHASDQTVRDALVESAAPVIASHSNCWAVHAHARNLKDELIRGICEKGGVIGVNYHGRFVSSRRPVTVADVADHIDHLVEIGGIECAALGSDFDGRIRPPRDLRNMAELPHLTAELARRGYSEPDLKKIYGQNFIRVLKEVGGE